VSRWTTFIRWKGTDLCMDFVCPECEGQSHFDGFFAYNIQCPDCGAVFKMPTDVPLVKVDKLTGDECILVGDGT
jgi:uncharacterized protein (DUF983 family)